MGPLAAGASATTTPAVARSEPGTNDDAMDTEESSATRSKRVKPTMGSEICVLETMDDVFNPAEARLGPSSTPNSDERFDVEDEVTHELHQMKRWVGHTKPRASAS